MTNRTLVIITGITGSLGNAYLRKIQNPDIVGISRDIPKERSTSIQYYHTDLLDKVNCKKVIKQLSLEEITKIVFIHPVGKFKFESDFKHIDEEVYASNVETFTNLCNPLLERIEDRELILVGFGSISDKYKVPYWQSYSKSKDALRGYIKEQAYHQKSVRGIFFNLSSVKTINESKLRPFADTSYWLTPEEIVARSIPELNFTGKWKEVDIFNLSPDFTPNIYTDYSKILARWNKEMYG